MDYNCKTPQSKTVKRNIMLVATTSINNNQIVLCENHGGKSQNLQKNKHRTKIALQLSHGYSSYW